MNIKLRPYMQTDFRHLKEMVFAFYKENPGREAINEDKLEDTVIELSSNPSKGKLIVFECEGLTVGYAILIVNWSNERGGNILIVDELYVKPEWRGKDIGTRFLNIAHLSEDNVVGLKLEVTPSSKSALTYYKSLGMKKTGHVTLMKAIGTAE